MTRQLQVFIETPFITVRPKNTDWLYMRSLCDLSKYSNLRIAMSREYRLVAEEAYIWASAKLKRTFKRQDNDRHISRLLRESAVGEPRPDVVYSHGRMPIIDRLPVVWFYGVVDPSMRISAGETQEAIENDYQMLAPMFQRAQLIVSPSFVTAERHKMRFPRLSNKFISCPFFLPHIRSRSDTEIAGKHEDDEYLRVLFVGREVKRKGLDLLIDAIGAMNSRLANRLIFDVVAPRDLVPPSIKQLPCKVCLHGELTKSEVMTLMSHSHVFAMPSRFESYGFVYLEAMANGAVVIAPNFEAQRELCANGQAGMLVTPRPQEITKAFTRLMDRSERMTLALEALRRFNECYSAEKVATQHDAMFRQAAYGT